MTYHLESPNPFTEQAPQIPTHPEQKPAQRNQEAVKQRTEALRISSEARALDGSILQHPELFGDHPSLTERIHRMSVMETIASGIENKAKRKTLGEDDGKGVNGTTERFYTDEHGEAIRTFVKPRSGEASFVYNPLYGNVDVVHRVFDPAQKCFTTEQKMHYSHIYPQAATAIKHYHERLSRFPILRQQIATYYDISPNEVPLNDTQYSPRLGIRPGELLLREYVASRIDTLLGMNVVPLTSLRAEEGSPDVASVQVAVSGTKLSLKIYNDLERQGKEHPGAQSFMRVACMDYLLNSLDRNSDNLLYDEQNHQFHAIDNGLTMGLSRTVDPEVRAEEESLKVDYATNNIRSTPLEIIQQHPDWILDDAAVEQLQRFYDAGVAYMKLRKEPPNTNQSSMDAASITGLINELSQHEEHKRLKRNSGLEVKFLTDLFRFLFQNEKIANKEAAVFLIKIRYLIQHRRPEPLKIGFGDNELFPTLHLEKERDLLAA